MSDHDLHKPDYQTTREVTMFLGKEIGLKSPSCKEVTFVVLVYWYEKLEKSRRGSVRLHWCTGYSCCSESDVNQ